MQHTALAYACFPTAHEKRATKKKNKDSLKFEFDWLWLLALTLCEPAEPHYLRFSPHVDRNVVTLTL